MTPKSSDPGPGKHIPPDPAQRRYQMGIIERNEDIRPLADASCRFGHNAPGKANLRKQFALPVTTDVHGNRERLAPAITV